MKLEMGKFYKTRDGRKAKIYSFDGHRSYPAHGAILNSDYWCMVLWDVHGYNGMSSRSPTDIVSEWVEPQPRRLAFSTPEGYIRLIPENEVPGDIDWLRLPHLDEPETK